MPYDRPCRFLVYSIKRQQIVTDILVWYESGHENVSLFSSATLYYGCMIINNDEGYTKVKITHFHLKKIELMKLIIEVPYI